MSINHDMLEKDEEEEEDSDFRFISSENVTHNKKTETEGSD